MDKIDMLGCNHVQLPSLLDDLIFKEFKAEYEPCRKDMVVLHWDNQEIVRYLGTYFPRSFSEAYCIFCKYFDSCGSSYGGLSAVNIFDFGCGTGGELLGLLFAIIEKTHIRAVNIKALDGNQHALRILETIVDKFNTKFDGDVMCSVISIEIDDIYDMSLTSEHIRENNDIILVFKSICEMASGRQFEERNPYHHVLQIMLSKLTSNGIICLADVTSFNEEQEAWLPNLIDKACVEMNVDILMRNCGYNEVFYVSHSGRKCDKSKIAWRILSSNKL